MAEKPLVFISCGQVATEEKELGQAICRLVEKVTPFRGYFAENQTDLDGVANHIFKNLYRAHGLIAVMHERGTVTGLKRRRWVRGSVWIEQEIAIAAFMRHVLDRSLNVALFTKPAVALEGAREKLMLNPVTFDAEAEILLHLEKILPTWRPLDERPAYDVTYRFERICTKETMNLHEYRLTFYVQNAGSVRASDYRLHVDFPTPFLYDTEKGAGYRPFTFSQDQFRGGQQMLYPGEEREAFRIDYYVDSRNWQPTTLRLPVKIALNSGDMPTKSEEIQMVKLQNF